MPRLIRRPSSFPTLAIIASALLVLPALVSAEASKEAKGNPLTFLDLMKFRQIEDPVISDDGRFVAYGLEPDRGDGEVVVRATSGRTELRVARGKAPALTAEGSFAAALLEPSLEAKEKAADEKDDDAKPKTGLALVNTANGDTQTWERVESFAFSEDGGWLVRHHFAAPKSEEADEGETEGEESGESGEAATDEDEEDAKDDAGRKGLLDIFEFFVELFEFFAILKQFVNIFFARI